MGFGEKYARLQFYLHPMHTNQLLLAGTINLCFDKIAKSCCTVSIKLLLLIVGKEIAHLKRIVPIAAFDYQISQPSTICTAM